jgi:N-acetylneuraminic acid mutarotase
MKLQNPFHPLLLIGCILVGSCNNESDPEPPASTGSATFTTKPANQISFTAASLSAELLIDNDDVFDCGFVWSQTPHPTTDAAEKKYFGPQTRSGSFSFNVTGLTINTAYYFRTFLITSEGVLYGTELSFTTQKQIEWDAPGVFPGDSRMHAISFIIGTKAYVGMGHSRDEEEHLVFHKDLWQFDMIENAWTRMADCPCEGRSGAVAFAIDEKGYVGTGSAKAGALKDLWQYDPVLNKWTEKAEFIGSAVSYATGFSLDGKGYLGTGVEFGNGDFLKTFYEYDPVADHWTQKADFPGLAVDQAIGFSIGDHGYIGMGLRMESWLGDTKQLWAYSPVTNTWTQKADCPSDESLDAAVAFVMNNNAYVGLGWGGGATIWKYDPESNSWDNDGAVNKGRIGAVAIPVSSQVLIGTGASGSGYYDDFETYLPE